MRHHTVAQLVAQLYTNSKREMAHWMWENHLQLVAHRATELAEQFHANADLAVAGAWLHDLGDAFVDRHTAEHEIISKNEAIKILQSAGYAAAEITEIIEIIVKPHSCEDGDLPQTLEGKVLATADALTHLTSDFYVQFTWKHVPQGKTYAEFIDWANEKIERDFHKKIFFADIQLSVEKRYRALKELFGTAKKES